MATITTLENKTYQVATEVAEVLETEGLVIRYQCNSNASSGKPFINKIRFAGCHIEIRGVDGVPQYLEFYHTGSMTPKTYCITTK